MFVAWRVREGGRKRVCRQTYKIEYPGGEEGKRSSSLVLRHLQLDIRFRPVIRSVLAGEPLHRLEPVPVNHFTGPY
jgi:hypothetical protein